MVRHPFIERFDLATRYTLGKWLKQRVLSLKIEIIAT